MNKELKKTIDFNCDEVKKCKGKVEYELDTELLDSLAENEMILTLIGDYILKMGDSEIVEKD